VTREGPDTLVQIGPGETRTVLATVPPRPPDAIAAAPGGPVYALDAENRVLYAVDPDTGEETPLSSEGHFACPEDVAVGAAGAIFVTDRCDTTFRVIQVDPATGDQTVVYIDDGDVGTGTCRIAASAAAGPFFVCRSEITEGGDLVAILRAWALDVENGVAASLGMVTGAIPRPPAGSTSLTLPTGIAGVGVLDDGRFVVGDNTLGGIWAFSTTAEPVEIASGGALALDQATVNITLPVGGVVPHAARCPFQGLLVDGDVLHVVDRTLVTSPPSCTTTLLTLPVAGGTPVATQIADLPSVVELVPHPNASGHALALVKENFWVGEPPAPIDDRGVAAVDLETGAQVAFFPHPSLLERPGILAEPTVITGRGTTTLWIADTIYDRVTLGRFDASTGALTRFPIDDDAAMFRVDDLALGPDGSVYVHVQRTGTGPVGLGQGLAGRIYRLDPETAELELLASTKASGSMGSTGGAQACGMAIATTPDGEVLFATRHVPAGLMSCMPAVERVEANGSSTPITTGGELQNPVALVYAPEPSPVLGGVAALLAAAACARRRARRNA